MLRILDIGNTFTRIAWWDGEKFTGIDRVPTAELALPADGIPTVAACVCPAVRERLHELNIDFISAENQHSKVDFSPVDCRTLGADRVANAVAAAEFFPLPAMVIDCGTAITCEVIDKECRFAGGAIAPGRKLMRSILAQGTAQLPEIPVSTFIPKEIGQNTRDAITFGVDNGAIGIIRRWIEVVQKKYPDLTLILTGGDAGFFAPALPEAVLTDDKFTLHGIRLACKIL
ncbi:MAG: type III pantothenate kinase [Lentisphaeria bacterium]|nr:type III pantothenate kinase [Lentisphaeria bacterium]